MKKQDIINRIKKYNINEYAFIKENSDLFLKDKIRFVNNWAMERCEDIVDFSDFNWNKVHNNDPEWAFMLNRQEYLIDLFISYVVENDVKYLEKIKQHIFEKITDLDEMQKYKNSFRTLDTGIRIYQWTFLLRNSSKYNLFTNHEEEIIKESIVKQINFLYENFEDRYYLSNWGSIQIAAVLIFNSLYDKILDKKIIDFFEKALEINVNISIYDDGTQWEQSSMYHVDVMVYYFNLLISSDNYFNILSDKLYKMAEYVYYVTGPDNLQFSIGDSDVIDTRDIMTWMSIFWKDDRFKEKSFVHPDILSYFMFTENMIADFENIKSKLVEKSSKVYKDSGQIFLKDKNFYLYFKNGVMGSSHTHSDLNSLCFYYKGEPIVIDSGRFTYVDCLYRNYFKSMNAHSSLIIDDECPEIVTGSWDYSRYSEPISLEFKENDIAQYIESSIRGEIKGGSYIHTRYVIKFKDKCLFIVDKVKMKGKHKSNIRFILDDNIKELSENGLKILNEERYSYKDTIISKKYNKIDKSKMIYREDFFEDELYISTVFYDESITIDAMKIRQTNKKDNLKGSFIWKINDEKEYSLNINTEPIITGSKILKIDQNDILTRGKCVIIDNIDNKFYRIKS
ncbi:heparinase II/III domain-containing protein [Helcococcus bovis]|uniref:heparinase II/III domain-containing protein n=1 Tax=Helcococcus bovis TaxID=3153252 RepID=UPI0038B85478